MSAKIIPDNINIKIFSRNINVCGMDECWEWKGYTNEHGYEVWSKRLSKAKIVRFLAHRVSFQILGKKILDENKVIDHKCKNRKCVNPLHLRQVTIAINTTENSDNFTAKNKLKTSCVRGHEFTKENTYIRIRKGNIGRQRLFCMKARHERGRLKKVNI